MKRKGYRVRVTRLDTGETFYSLSEAAKRMYCSSHVLKTARYAGRTEVYGIPVRFEETDVHGAAKGVKNMTTGEIFPSVVDAAKAYGKPVQTLY